MLAELDQFRGDYRPTYVFAVGAARDARGAWWYRISVPGRPNGRYGWIRSGAALLEPVQERLVVDLKRRQLTLYTGRRLRLRTRVAVGAPGMETPTGRFYVTAAYRGQEPVLGAYAFETSAYSKLSDWPGGGIVGIHGTDQPQRLGQAVSHGCVRLSNKAALRLKALVRPGAEVDIVR